MRLYCEKVGIPYEESMTKWEHPVKDDSIFKDFFPFHEDILKSSQLLPPKDIDDQVMIPPFCVVFNIKIYLVI